MSSARLIECATLVAESMDSGSLSDDQIVAAVRRVGELRRLVDAAGVHLASLLENKSAAGGPDAPDRTRGHTGVPALLQAEAGLDRRDAVAWSSVGTATSQRTTLTGQPLPPHRPALAAAVQEGTIGLGAADRIARALRDASPHATPEQIDEFERILVACAPQLSERELRAACRRIVDLVDPDGAEPREDDLRRRSSVTVHQQDDGLTRVIALIHPEGAGYLLAALDARTAPRREPVFALDGAALEPSDDDRRPLALRRADALIGIARDALTHDTGHVAGAPVTVVVTMTLEQLTDGHGVARISGVDEPISAGTARRMAADAAIIPAVLGSESELLDQGRASRLATTAQRRALDLRDRGCIWGRCSAPPGWCEVAHIDPWATGGPTDLANLALMCGFHHRLFDREGWSLLWEGRDPYLIPPPHVDSTRTPMRAGPPPRLIA